MGTRKAQVSVVRFEVFQMCMCNHSVGQIASSSSIYCASEQRRLW